MRSTKLTVSIIALVMALVLAAGCGGGGGGGSLSGSDSTNGSARAVDVEATVATASPVLLMAPQREAITSNEVVAVDIDNGATLATGTLSGGVYKVSIPLAAAGAKTFAALEYRGNGRVIFRQVLGRIPYDSEVAAGKSRIRVPVKIDESSTVRAIELLQDRAAFKTNFDIPIATGDDTDGDGMTPCEKQISQLTDLSSSNARMQNIAKVVKTLSGMLRERFVSATVENEVCPSGIPADMESVLKAYIRASRHTDGLVQKLVSDNEGTTAVVINGVTVRDFTEGTFKFNRVPVVSSITASLSTSEISISYNASDADGDTISVAVYYYLKNGQTENLFNVIPFPAAVGVNTIKIPTSFVLDVKNIGRVKLVPNDGRINGNYVIVNVQ